MLVRRFRPVFALVVFGLSVASSTRAADFSGRWALEAGPADRDAAIRGERAPDGGETEKRSALVDLPLEALTAARLLVISDDGSVVKVIYGEDRVRQFFVDGDERELDDRDGPAKVTAKRKGETLVVASKWSNGHRLAETWALLANPRRIVVTGRVSGRESFRYERVYVPAPPPTPAPTTAFSATPAGTVPAPTPVTAPFGVGMAACSIRPPRGTSAEDLARLAKITAADARNRATAAVAPLRVTAVISSDVEVNEGCLVWPMDLRLLDRKGVQEVLIDAGDGKVLSSKFEAQNAP